MTRTVILAALFSIGWAIGKATMAALGVGT